MRLYAQKGVKEYWIVDPMEEKIEVYDNAKGSFEMISQAQKKGFVQSGTFNSLRVGIENIFDIR